MFNLIYDISNVIAERYKISKEAISFDVPLDVEKGDIATSIAFKLSKELRKKPDEIAKDIENLIMTLSDKNGLGLKVKIINGYINIFIPDHMYFKDFKFDKTGKHYIVEGPSVNPNKPWHIGHLRNALLCSSISNIIEENGNEVIRLDYINDLGLQVAQSYWYYKKYGKKHNTGNFALDIGLDYVQAAKIAEMEKKEIEEVMKNIESNKEIEFRKFIINVLKSQKETAYKYGIYHDFIVFESHVSSLFAQGIKMLSSLKEVEKPDQGEFKDCLVVNIDNANLKNPLKVLVRSNGIPTYFGKDVIFHLWKTGNICCIGFCENHEIQREKSVFISCENGKNIFNVKDPVIINVIGHEQSLNQEVLKKTLIKLNALKEGQFFHIGYGLVRKKDERFSGRKGTWIGFTADELLEEGIKRIKEGDKDKIALAAIKFSMLKISSKKELIFDWDKALSIQGDSGPYVLYSLVRAKNILKNSSSLEYQNLKLENKNLDLNKEEKMLMRLIWAYPFYVKKAFMSFEPNVICDYLLDLCQSFNTFYEKHRVIGSDKEEIRLNIIRHFVKTCEKALYLLGIQPVNYM